MLEADPTAEPSEPAEPAEPEPETEPTPNPGRAETSAPTPASTATSNPPRESKGAVPPSATRRFELVSDASKKFWEITLSSNAFTVRFGRIGTAGQTQTKTFPDESAARREMEKLINEKSKKGYAET